tara:strand:- start:209 stop:376 length:168 start_codon:yes stop_codon:yes gene_type:complete
MARFQVSLSPHLLKIRRRIGGEEKKRLLLEVPGDLYAGLTNQPLSFVAQNLPVLA